MKFFYSLSLVLALSIYSTQSFAVQIVRIQIDYNGKSRIMDLELFDGIAKSSVGNFLNYVNDDGINGHRYDATFITRNIPGFIIQTGSYTFKPADPLTEMLTAVGIGTPLQPVPTGASITNDFNLSNIRGTIAFAKISNNPDSATSGWFINLGDNSTNLDNQNGGFTVFGSVIDDGMIIADEISSLPKQVFAGGSIGSDFSDLPVAGYDFLNFPGIYRSNLVMLTSFTVINRPIIRFTPSSIDFKLDVAGDGIEKLITTTLKNTGNENLKVGAITNLLLSYNIKTDTCSNTTLLPQSIDVNSTCSITIAFSPTTLGVFSDNLVVPYTSAVDASVYSVSLPITGEGVPLNAVSTTSISDITYSEIAIQSATNKTITIRNKGGNPLSISSITLTGINNDQYTVANTGCVVGSILNMNETCILTVYFSPTSTGTKNATLEILTNTNTSNINLNGTATKPEMSVQSSVNLYSKTNQTASNLFLVTNIGTGNLVFSDISISGSDAAFFTELNNCPDTNNSGTPTQSLSTDGTCGLFIEFNPTDSTKKTATLTITSNDPIKPTIDIIINGFIDNDSDGIVGSIERASPNGGDNNNDDINDDNQSNVATLAALNSNYITFISDNSLLSGTETAFSDVTLVDTIPTGKPKNVTFNYGIYSYSISLPAGDGVNMAILLPANASTTGFYKYGPTIDNTSDHWYNFKFDDTTQTGAKFLGLVTMHSPTGKGVQRNLVIVSYIDGRRGDDDLTVNGSILNKASGLDIANTSAGSSSGSISFLQLFILFIINLLKHVFIQIRNKKVKQIL